MTLLQAKSKIKSYLSKNEAVPLEEVIYYNSVAENDYTNIIRSRYDNLCRLMGADDTCNLGEVFSRLRLWNVNSTEFFRNGDCKELFRNVQYSRPPVLVLKDMLGITVTTMNFIPHNFSEELKKYEI